MTSFSAALCILAGLAAIVGVCGIGAYLVINGHPYVGAMTIIFGALISVKTKSRTS